MSHKAECGRVVVKIGSSLFFSRTKGFDQRLFDNFVGQVCAIADSGRDIVLVSSGAIALGMGKLGLKSRPRELSVLQASAAVGQSILMDKYRDGFNGRRVEAQLLLTWEDFNDRKRYLNAKNTLLALLKLGVIPVINENDTVATDEIKFGDNDRLSAMVATMVSADILVILTDVDGLLDGEKKLRRSVPAITREVRAWASPTDKHTCVGGMVTKIDAARIAVESGIPCVIASGRIPGNLERVTAAPFCGGAWTVFEPKRRLSERHRWIAFGSRPRGSVLVDEGAQAALMNNKSLLSVGVVGTSGRFSPGDVVCISDRGGDKFAVGVSAFASTEVDRIKGSRCDREIIHRDDIVIL